MGCNESYFRSVNPNWKTSIVTRGCQPQRSLINRQTVDFIKCRNSIYLTVFRYSYRSSSSEHQNSSEEMETETQLLARAELSADRHFSAPTACTVTGSALNAGALTSFVPRKRYLRRDQFRRVPTRHLIIFSSPSDPFSGAGVDCRC